MKRYIFLVVFALLSTYSLYAEELPANGEVQVELIQEEQTVQPGRPFWVAIHLKTPPHWHFYWKNPGDAGMATQIEWDLPPGFSAGPIEWPTPQRFDLNSLTGFGYEGDVWLLALIYPTKILTTEAPVKIGANLRWVVCDDSNCVPGDTSVTAELPVSLSLPQLRAEWLTSFANARALLPQKQWNLRALASEGFVQVQIQAPDKQSSNYIDAEFFPEEPGIINPQAKALLSGDPNMPGYYILTLKTNENAPAPKILKGVLALRNAKKSESLNVDLDVKASPDAPASSQSVAMTDLPILDEPLPVSDPTASSSVEFEGGIALALLFAFMGGFLLNLMPCVLPVVSFKVLGFVKMAGQSRTLTMKHGIAFSAGVILSFWVFAGLLLILQAYGRSVGWGFQLQEPLFVASLAALLLMLGLSLFGVFELGTSVTAAAGQASSRSGLFGSFLSGILATAVATPCTGPFLGSALGFAVTLPAPSALLIFTSLGVGMALPYLVLAAFPQLLRFLPKPGPWMITFKEIMGFLMIATVLWLLWVFGAQTSSLGVAMLLCSFFLLAVGGWIFGKWGTPIQATATRWTSYALFALCTLSAGYVVLLSTSDWVAAYDGYTTKTSAESDVWQDFSAEKIADLQKKGIPVFVDFTARWCLICQTNHLVLSTAEVSKKFDDLGVVRMKADWTKSDPAITEALRKFGRNGVPLYILYGTDPSKPPVVLPQVLTPDLVIQYLNQVSLPVADR